MKFRSKRQLYDKNRLNISITYIYIDIKLKLA
jgi:hypothetical protein